MQKGGASSVLLTNHEALRAEAAHGLVLTVSCQPLMVTVTVMVMSWPEALCLAESMCC